MKRREPSHDEWKQRAEDAEAIVGVLREGRVDAVVGTESVILLRLAETEKQLRRTQARLRVALEAAEGGIYEHAVPLDEGADHDDRWASILGYRREELPPTDVFLDWFNDQVHPDDRARLHQTYREFIEGRTQRYEIDIRLKHNQGHWVWVHDVARAAEYDEKGRVRRLVGMMFDISRQKQNEEDLKKAHAAALKMMEDAVEARRQTEEAKKELRSINETLESQVAERTAVARRRARTLRRMAAELSETEHRERKRLARVLHDDLQQLLLAAKLRLRPLLDADPVQLEEHIERIEELLDECMAASRNLSHELSPSVLQQGTLDKVVEWLGEWFSEKHGLNVAVDTPGELPPTPDHLRVFLFQAIRELLFNVVKHSGNQEARVRLAPQEGCLTIQVEDDGDGFDPSSVERRLHDPEGFGLFNIRERLEALLGRLEIQRATSGGACFRLVIPLAKNTESV